MAAMRLRQFHNQAPSSPLHRHLVALWAAVAAETDGAVITDVHPQNGDVAGSDPAVLQMLIRGEVDFFTLMGGLLAPVIPLADFQSVPFAFRDAAHALSVSDGRLGWLLRQEMAAQGLHGFRLMTFDNGMRQIGTKTGPVHTPADLADLTIRVPDGAAFLDTFRALGAKPIAINVNGIVPALESGQVDAQENALAVMEVFRLDRQQRFVALSNHMWSGFNLMANLAQWRRLPADIQGIIERHVDVAIRQQRDEQAAFNASVQAAFEARGLAFNVIDQAPFRAKLAPVYAHWKTKLGTEAWALLEQDVGRLG
jgi:TRAP-type transport system periplasmic protein